MSRAPDPMPALTPAQQERLRLFETGLRAFLDAPTEVLLARGIVGTFAELEDVRRRGPRWFLGADDAAATAFFLLIEEAHAAGEAALAASPSAPT